MIGENDNGISLCDKNVLTLSKSSNKGLDLNDRMKAVSTETQRMFWNLAG